MSDEPRYNVICQKSKNPIVFANSKLTIPSKKKKDALEAIQNIFSTLIESIENDEQENVTIYVSVHPVKESLCPRKELT